MVKEFQRFHILLVTLVLLVDRVLSILLEPLLGDKWAYRLAGAVLLLSAVLLVHFADNIGLGLLKWRPLRSFLIQIRQSEDPTGRFVYAMVDMASESVLGYMTLRLSFANGSYGAEGKFFSLSHESMGEVTIDSVALREKPQADGYDRLFMSCTAVYYSRPDTPYSGMMEVAFASQTGSLFIEGFLNYDRVASPISLRGIKLPKSRSSAHSKNCDAQLIEELLKSIDRKLYEGSHEEYLSQNSVRPTNIESAKSAVRVSCKSRAYAHAWRAYLAGCEGHGKRNQLFAEIAEYVANDKQLADRTGDDLFTVLDLGCGNGIGGYSLAFGSGPISHYIGVDCNKWLLDNIDWQKGTNVSINKVELDLVLDELDGLKLFANNVDLILMVRLLNHMDARSASRLLHFCHTKYPSALMLIVNPTYRLKIVGYCEGEITESIEELLACEPEQQAFQGVKYDHYVRTEMAYRKAALCCGYSEVNVEGISTGGLPGEASHFILSAKP